MSKIIKNILFSLILISLLFMFSACGGGTELCRIEGEDYIYILFGNPNSVTRIDVCEKSDLEVVVSIETDYRVNEPWLGENTGNYGFRACDVNGDGHEDVTLCRVRRSEKEQYLFYLADGKGGYKLEDKLSDFVAPVFGDGSGQVKITVFARYDTEVYDDMPPIYELRSEERVYDWNERGRIFLSGGTRFSYYSETDIYCYATCIPDPENDERLIPDEEMWIRPDRLADMGLEPLE